MKRNFLPLLAGGLWLAALEGFAVDPPTLAAHAFMPGGTLSSSNTTLITVLGQPFVFDLSSGPTSKVIGGILAPDPVPEIPCLTITCPTNMAVDCTNATLGTAVFYSVSASNTCFPGTLVTTYCVPDTGTRFLPGTWPVDCDAISAVGAGIETNHCSFTVTVRSTCPPEDCLELHCSTNRVAYTCGTNCVPVDFLVRAENHCNSNDVRVVSSPDPGTCFPPGTHTVDVWAISSSQTIHCSFTVTVSSNCPPYVLSASSLDGWSIGVCFDQPVAMVSAERAANYLLNGGAIPVMSATLREDGTSVRLLLGGQLSGGSFSLLATNILNLSSNLGGGTVVGLAPSNALTAFDLGQPMPTGTVFSCESGSIEIVAGGADIWGAGDQCTFVSRPLTGDFDVWTKVIPVSSLDNAIGGLAARESASDASAKSVGLFLMPNTNAPPNYLEAAALIRSIPGTNSINFGTANPVDLSPMPRFRLRRLGNVFTTFVSQDGVAWKVIGQTDTASNPFGEILFVGFGAASVASNQTATVEFRDFRFAQPAAECLEWRCPTNMTLPCQVAGGSLVTFDLFRTNHCDPSDVFVDCNHPSGSLFAVGTTTVHCFVIGSGETNNCTFTVTVLSNCPPNTCGPNLLVNGSFESPGSPDGWIDVPGGSSLIPGWTTLVNGLEYYNPTANRWGAFDGYAARGQFVVDLTPFERNGGGLAQTFSTVPGHRYRVSFYMSTLERNGRDGTGSLTASAPGMTETFSVENHASSHAWALKIFEFVAAPGTASSTLSFTTTDDSGLHVVGIDDVRVSDCCDLIDCPPDLYVPCQGNGGATVDYAILNRTICPNMVLQIFHWCEPASGSFFPVGATPVTCTDSNRVTGEITRCSFTVTVLGNCSPSNCLTMVCPTNLFEKCQSTNGAFVFYNVRATNHCSTSTVPVNCAPPSGTLFAPGTHSARCVALSEGITNQCSFTVTVDCSAPPLRISGVVRDGAGQLAPGIQIALTGAVARVTRTDSAGRFEFSGLPVPASYAVMPDEAYYQFAPARHDFLQATQDVTADFVVVTPFEQWQQTSSFSNTPPALKLPEADPDGDGMPNLLEYAFGYNPFVPDSQGQLRIEFEKGPTGPRPVVCFRLAPYATDIDFQLEYTDRLDDSVWQILPESIIPTAGPPPPGWPEVRIPIPARLLPAGATFWRLDVCRRARTCPYPALRANNGDSLRIGFMNVQFMDSAAMFIGSVIGDFQECCGGDDRGGDIARRIIAGDYDVVALAEVWVDGGGLLPKALETYGPTVELAAREWARRHLPASTTEEEIVSLIETWERNLGARSGNSKARLTELLGRAGYIHRVEKLDDSGNLQDSGLMLFSRWPFERLPAETRTASARYIRFFGGGFGSFDFGVRAFSGTTDWSSDVAFIEFPYEHCSGYECQSAKGAGFVRIRNPHTGLIYNVGFTHLQANDDGDDMSARAGQLGDIKEMIETILGGRVDHEPVLVVGDFNIKGSLTPRDEWEKYFRPGGEAAWGGFFINTLTDGWERQVAIVGDAHSPPLPGVAPVAAAFRDPGLTGNADVGGNARYDYLLVNDPALINNQYLSVQHLALAYDLMGEPTDNRAAFGFVGARILSDHFGLVADINLRRDHCSPPIALVESDLRHEDERGKSYPGSIQLPGSMQWWRFDARGTYSFGVTRSNDFEYLVFSSRDLSRPLKPVRPEPRILSYQDPSGQSNQVIAYSFHTDDAPLYVRVTARSRSSTGDFGLVARRHQCVSQDDFCELRPNAVEFEVRPLPATVSDRERWFRLQTECPTSRRPQSIGFAKRPADPALLQHHAVSLEAFVGGSFTPLTSPVESTALIQLGNPAFNDGGDVVYARVTPFSDTPRTTYYVRWTNNLTVFDAHFIRNDEPLDNDVIWDNQDDEFDRIVLALRASAVPDATILWSQTAVLSGSFLDFNDKHRRDVSLAIFPTVRFLPDEVFTIEFDEDDVTTHDEMSATVPALEEAGVGSEIIGAIQPVSGDDGRYQIYGRKRHFGIRALPQCPDP